MTKSIRDAYGEALKEYGGTALDVVVLDADVSGSTKSCIFADAFPERFFNVGIAESNMMAMAAGMAAIGKIPFVNSFAVFLASSGLLGARTFGSYSKLPIKIMGGYGGLSDSFDGPSHHSIEDIAIMRALPNFKVFAASDPAQTRWLVRNAIDDPSPMYIRLSRDALPELYSRQDAFEAGKGRILRKGKDAAIIACGLMVSNALEAAKRLSAIGYEITVVDMFCIKPLDTELVAELARETGAIITAEEHSVIGGLGGAVAEALMSKGVPVPMAFVGLDDCHAECGPYALLQKKYGLDAEAVAAKALEAIRRKS